MEQKKLNTLIEDLLLSIEKLIPNYVANPEDNTKSEGGNVAVCIIDQKGQIFGRMFGTNKIRVRQTYKVAWTKASQVWITGMKTGEYEKLVFAGKVDEHKYGISKPDLIGWEGGQPIVLEDDTTLSIGFSGFSGESDLEIIIKAFALMNVKIKS